MTEEFTQGTLIRYIRSPKYPEIRCIGVVITARCDLANNKVKQFYCLSSMLLEDWIYEVLYQNLLLEKKKNIIGNIRNSCTEKGLDFEALSCMNFEKIRIVFQEYYKEKELRNIEKKLIEWEELEKLGTVNSEKQERKRFLAKNKNKVKEKLCLLNNGAYPKYVVLPGKAYLENGARVNGIVVDLQDIIAFDISVRDKIMNCEYDYPIIEDANIREQINKQFFFESADDMVLAVEKLTSPWTEYVLQQYGYSFMRIGVDNASDEEIKEYCDSILGENE